MANSNLQLEGDGTASQADSCSFSLTPYPAACFSPASRIRVLVVDDVPDVLRILCAVLEQYQSVDIAGTATDGKAAIEAAEQLQPDLVVLDVSMPVMDGLQAAAHLRAMLPDTRILMTSADDYTELREACLDAGADTFLYKGTFGQDLPACLESLFGGHLFTPKSLSLSIGDQRPDSTSNRQEAEMSYDFHKENYERYERLLGLAQASGNWVLAKSAAKMVLFHLHKLFQTLPSSRKQAVRSTLAMDRA